MDIVSLLKKNALFSELDDSDLHEVEKLFCLEIFKEDDMIFKEGAESDKLYIVISGLVSIFQQLGSGYRELTRLGPKDIFGEMALLVGGKRSASARALTDTECLTLHKATFLQIQKNSNAFNEQLEQLLIRRIEKTEQSANLSLLTAYNSLLFSLSNLVEARDNETAGHLNRVRHYCKLLAQKMAEKGVYTETITPLFIENIFIVSPMHDIGKVAIPDAILQKPGKLTEAEFEIMKTHAEVGANLFARILEDINFPTFQMGRNLTHYHHERFDGGGYPVRLSGQQIPLEARIMAVADVFDALLSKRYYKEAFTKDAVVRIIEESKGGHFDPTIADVLLGDCDEFVAIHKKYS